MAKPYRHKKKVFIDEGKQYLYWPISMPFWVRLTNSPAEDAPSFLLQKVHPGSKEALKKHMQQGITLEIEGKQFIRWYNRITGETIFLKFYADGSPPTAKIIPVHAPSFKIGERIFYGKGLKLSISAEDEISGVEAIYVSTDGASFVPYRDTISLDEEKTYHIRAYAVDCVGYAGEPETNFFSVDITAPETRHEVKGVFSGGVLCGGASIRFTASDRLSGLKNTYYGFDGQSEPSLYKNNDIVLEEMKDGEHSISYFSVDNVGNREERHVYNFYLDRTPPRTAGNFLGDHYKAGEKDFVSSRTKIELTAEDNKIGVEKIEFTFKGNEYETFVSPLPLSLEQGEHRIRFRAVDKFGNISSRVEVPFFVDRTPPKSMQKIKGAHFTQRNDTWITKDATVHLNAGDEASGLGGIYYQLGEGVALDYRLYDAPISIAREGRYLFKYYSMDNVGNREAEHIGILVVDNTPPQLVTTFSLVRKRGVLEESGSSLDVYPRYTSLFLAASDNSSGIASIRCSINGGKEEEYTQAILFRDEGTFSIKICIEDNLSNVTHETIRFVIEE